MREELQCGVDQTITAIVHRLPYLDGVYGFRRILPRRIETLTLRMFVPRPEVRSLNFEFEIDFISNHYQMIQTKQHTIKQLMYKTVFNKVDVEMTASVICSLMLSCRKACLSLLRLAERSAHENYEIVWQAHSRSRHLCTTGVQ